MLENRKQQVWEQLRRLDPVLAGQIQVNALDLTSMRRLIDQPSTAILSFYTTNTDTHIFVLRQNQINCHTCKGQGITTLQDSIFDNWLQSYVAEKAEWRNQISDFLSKVAEWLELNSLISKYLNNIEEIIIIPHLYLHQIPFAALPIENNQYLGNKFLIRYVPNCQTLQFCQQRSPIAPLSYGTVEDADGTLPGASFEGDKIAKLYNIPDRQRLRGRTQATLSNYRNLLQQIQVLHSSHHAQSRLDNPLESKLLLGDGTITLGQLLTPGWRLPNLSDVFLSCCETNLGVTPITDDILTLATGFLCAGARSVVSTLWAVDDLATALFSIFYYEYRKEGYNRPEALRQAQFKLRSLTGETLASNYQADLDRHLKQQLAEAEKARKEAKAKRDKEAKDTEAYQKWDKEHNEYNKIGQRITRLKKEVLPSLCQEPFPFANPFYWAAFICQGLR